MRRVKPLADSREAGMSISMAVLALTMVSMIILYVGTQTLNSMYNTRKKSHNSVGMAAGDSAIEKYRAALQSGIADETNGFLLDRAALELLVKEQPNTSVEPNGSVPGASAMVPVRLASTDHQFTVREEGTDTVGWWQLYDVIPPRYLHRPSVGAPATDLVVYIRAWATSKSGGTITTKPRVFRVEYRPGFFSDYQSVTDAPFFVKDNSSYTINGPIHSNGYETVEWLARDDSGASRRGIWLKDPPFCTDKARFTTSQGTDIVVPPDSSGSCSAAVASGKKNARQISLLGVQHTFRHIESRCGRPAVVCRSGAATYDVRLGAGSVRVNGTTFPLVEAADSASLTILVDSDVVLHGALTMPANRAGRVTIATRRLAANDRQPQVFLRGDLGSTVGAATPAKDSIGVITQGDVVLDTRNVAPCMRNIALAAISQSGSVTVAPEFVTLAPPAYDLNSLECGQTTNFTGSFAAHGQFIASIKWPDVRTGGWTGVVGYSQPVLTYNRNLFLNPPPMFPTATPWTVTKVKDAHDRCLVPPNAGVPTCE